MGGPITLNSLGGDSNNYCDYSNTLWCALEYLAHANISIGIGAQNCSAGTGAGTFNTDRLDNASIG